MANLNQEQLRKKTARKELLVMWGVFFGVLMVGWIIPSYIRSNDSKTDWECVDITSIDQNWENDFKCINKITGEEIKVSKERANYLEGKN